MPITVLWRWVAAFMLFSVLLMAETCISAQSDLLSSTNEKNLIGNSASAWSFGVSSDRGAPIWRKGVDGKAMSGKTTRKTTDRKPAADTSKGIESAVAKAQAKGPHSTIGLSLENNTTSWKVSPQQKALRPDEELVRDRKHILRAYAGIESEDDLSISIGPELIMHDETYSNEAAHSGQPDSAFGLGMKFEYDF